MYKEELAYAQTPERTAAILTDEASAVHKSLLYAEVFGPTGYARTTKYELGDAVSMIFLLCEQLGYNFEEVRAMGLERFKERMSQLKEGHQ